MKIRLFRAVQLESFQNSPWSVTCWSWEGKALWQWHLDSVQPWLITPPPIICSGWHEANTLECRQFPYKCCNTITSNHFQTSYIGHQGRASKVTSQLCHAMPTLCFEVTLDDLWRIPLTRKDKDCLLRSWIAWCAAILLFYLIQYHTVFSSSCAANIHWSTAVFGRTPWNEFVYEAWVVARIFLRFLYKKGSISTDTNMLVMSINLCCCPGRRWVWRSVGVFWPRKICAPVSSCVARAGHLSKL